ncbi:cytotoxic translational repressor of toxin-antitoxin stability system [Desulfosporosinus acidiphilus SJ4]|uniref:Cytotoxic translational repressor of toxin-antitoxin stability system n=1 Tax=Desulfosporosinus acidiphilus (strain DSM 22704 / JCM 16185 / SJ4) TaxID=646529 RepID=I4D801_DESAJ|nr:AbrB family transcriptional regulator [Desulfosporosinus acidiphilus]AFM41925.1 cytotoxic translational repressor of toxin-antitoxin stability system [Desulfosporosinus acidiphilus SJ4]
METYRVKVGAEGEILLPLELRNLFGIAAEDTLDLCVDSEGKVFVRTAERSVGPLSDFFEDLIIGELHGAGYTGDELKTRLLECKIKLSTVLDRMSEEGHRAHKNSQSVNWRFVQNTPWVSSNAPQDSYQVVLTTRGIHDLAVLHQAELKEIPAVLSRLEEDPFGFKRLKGPYYETYRVSFRSGIKEYRVIYTIFGPENLVVVLTVGEREAIYKRLNGIA